MKSTYFQNQPFFGVLTHPNVNLKNSNIAQLRPQLNPAKNKINYIFGTIGHRLKIQKAKLLTVDDS